MGEKVQNFHFHPFPLNLSSHYGKAFNLLKCRLVQRNRYKWVYSYFSSFLTCFPPNHLGEMVIEADPPCSFFFF